MSGVSFAYPLTLAEERARLALTGSALRQAYRAVADSGEEVFLLSTCLRLEVVTPADRSSLERILKIVFDQVPASVGGVIRAGAEQIHHLFRVAAGVESPVLGEPEVLGQFRTALDIGRREQAIGGLFERLLGESVGAGRAARRMLPGSPYGSLARVAAQLARASDEVAVFGAGSMARAVVQALAELPATCRVTVYARRPQEVDLPGVGVAALEEVPRVLRSDPVAISATSAKHSLFAPEMLEEVLAARTEDLLLIDLAMPPDFLPTADASHLRYFGVDDLARLARRERPSDEVEAFLAEAAAAASVRLANHGQVGPVIAAILGAAGRAVEEEVERFAGRAGEEEREVLEQLAHTVARRVLHGPISYLSTHPDGATAAEAFGAAFGVNDDG
jgi:glutamyl-tRNA reductase